MACGTACVATDAGADGEVLDQGAGIVMSTQGVTTQLRTLLPVLETSLSPRIGRQAVGCESSSDTRSAAILMPSKPLYSEVDSCCTACA